MSFKRWLGQLAQEVILKLYTNHSETKEKGQWQLSFLLWQMEAFPSKQTISVPTFLKIFLFVSFLFYCA